jgi:hypothetical protein
MRSCTWLCKGFNVRSNLAVITTMPFAEGRTLDPPIKSNFSLQAPRQTQSSLQSLIKFLLKRGVPGELKTKSGLIFLLRVLCISSN